MAAALAAKSGSLLSHHDLRPDKSIFLRPQEPPDVLDVDVAERLRQQRSRPVGISRRRLLIEKRQNAGVVKGSVFGLRAPFSRVREAGHAEPGEAHTPLRRCANRAGDRAGDLARRRSIPRHQHDPRPQALPVRPHLRSGKPTQLSPLGVIKRNRRRVGNAFHASLNHDS